MNNPSHFENPHRQAIADKLAVELEIPNTVLVTGGDSEGGGGLYNSLKFSSAGCDIVLMGLNPDLLDRNRQACLAAGANDCLCLPGDLCDQRYVESATEAIFDTFGGLDLAILNHALAPSEPAKISEMSSDLLVKTIINNGTTAHRLVQPIFKSMLNRGAGKLIFVGSISSETPGFGQPAYGISKSVLAEIARRYAMESAPYFPKMAVLSAILGTVPTNNTSWRIREQKHHRIKKDMGLPYSRRKLFSPEEVADHFFWWACNPSPINGSVYLDSGFSLANGFDLTETNFRDFHVNIANQIFDKERKQI